MPSQNVSWAVSQFRPLLLGHHRVLSYGLGVSVLIFRWWKHELRFVFWQGDYESKSFPVSVLTRYPTNPIVLLILQTAYPTVCILQTSKILILLDRTFSDLQKISKIRMDFVTSNLLKFVFLQRNEFIENRKFERIHIHKRIVQFGFTCNIPRQTRLHYAFRLKHNRNTR